MMRCPGNSMRRAFALLMTIFCLFALNGFRAMGEGGAVTVCILDSGSNLEGMEGWNFLNASADISDAVGHGTAVSALVAERAPDARIVMLKCFESEAEAEGEAIVTALYAAVDDYGADIINMSWTLNVEDEALFAAVCHAWDAGAVLLAPAGNLSFASGLGKRVYPAAWEQVIGVSGVDLDDSGNPTGSLWYLSGDWVYVCAAAEYDGERGSSYASARIAGILAAHWSEMENPGPEAASQYLKNRAIDLGEAGYDKYYGWGYVPDVA